MSVHVPTSFVVVTSSLESVSYIFVLFVLHRSHGNLSVQLYCQVIALLGEVVIDVDAGESRRANIQ